MAITFANVATGGATTPAKTTCTFTNPGAGKLLILWCVGDDYITTSGTGRPESTGWTLIQNQNTGFHGTAMWLKVSAGSETSVDITLGSAARMNWAIDAGTNIDTTTPLNTSAKVVVNSSNISTNASNALTPTGSGNCAVYNLFGSSTSGGGITAATGFSASYTAGTSSFNATGTPSDAGTVAYLATQARGSAAPTTTGTWGGTTPQSRSCITAIFNEAASGTNYTPSQSDAEGLADAATAGQDNVRAAADPVGLTDSAFTAAATARSQSDAVGLTDTASATQAVAPTVTDPLGITDTATSVVGQVRQVADPVGLTDALAGLQGMGRAQSDAVGLTDLLAAAQSLVRAIADSVGLTDALSPAQTLGRQQDDPIGITDAANGVITGAGGTPYYGWAETDQSGILTFGADASAINVGTEWWTSLTSQNSVGVAFWVDAAATGSLTAGSCTGALYAVDGVGTGFPTGSPLATATFGTLTTGAWNDCLWSSPVPLTANTLYAVVVFTPGNLYSAAAFYFNSSTDLPAPSGASGLVMGRDGSGGPNGGTWNGVFKYNATLAPPDSDFHAAWYGVNPILAAASGGTSYTAAPSDAEGITDAASPVQDNVRTVTDPVGLVDAAATSLGAARTVTDPVGLVDAAAAVQGGGRTQPDPVGITDSATASIGNLTPTITDPVGVTDTASSQQANSRTSADAVGLTDAASTAATVNVTISDSIGVADTGAAQQIDYAYTVTDPVGVTDSVSGIISSGGTNYTPSQSDAEGVTDSAVAAQVSARTTADPVGVTDVASSASSFPRTQADAVGLTDSVTAVISFTVTASDPVGLTDAATVVVGSVRIQADPVGVTDHVTAALSGVFRDITISVTTGADRWGITTGPPRWALADGSGRWLITTTQES